MVSQERKGITRRQFSEGLIASGVALFLPNLPEIKIPENKIESLLEQAYQECFRTFEIAGKKFTLRIPFGLWHERFPTQQIFRWGKGSIGEVWEETNLWLKNPYFLSYLEAIQQPGEKVIHFDLVNRKFTIKKDKPLLEKMKRIYDLREEFNLTGNWRLVNEIARLYPGNDAQVYLLKRNSEITQKDIDDPRYCIAGLGIDCARFAYHCQEKIYGNQLSINLSKKLGVRPEAVPYYIGSWFYYPPECNLVFSVEPRIANLQPGDVIHFRSRRTPGLGHSVIIQAVDFKNSFIRYLQCTDWAKSEERGVHESFIYFNNPNQYLKDAYWTQELHPTFPGETAPYGWRNEGDRYRDTYTFVARLKESVLPF